MAKGALPMVTALAGITAATAAVVNGFKKAISASIDHNRVIRLATRAGVDNIAATDKQAEAMQRLTGVSSDLIVQQTAVGVAQGLNTESAYKMAEAALAASRALGRDFVGTHAQLTKTIGGTLGEMAELIPALKSLTVEELKAGKGADMLLEMFGGELAGDIKDVDLQMKILRGSVDDLFQAAGDKMFERLFGTSVGEEIALVAKSFDKMTESINSIDQDKIDKLAEIAFSGGLQAPSGFPVIDDLRRASRAARAAANPRDPHAPREGGEGVSLDVRLVAESMRVEREAREAAEKQRWEFLLTLNANNGPQRPSLDFQDPTFSPFQGWENRVANNPLDEVIFRGQSGLPDFERRQREFQTITAEGSRGAKSPLPEMTSDLDILATAWSGMLDAMTAETEDKGKIIGQLFLQMITMALTKQGGSSAQLAQFIPGLGAFFK